MVFVKNKIINIILHNLFAMFYNIVSFMFGGKSIDTETDEIYQAV